MINYNIFQRTISSSVSFSGVGLHSGNLCNVTLRPSEADTGITFNKSIDWLKAYGPIKGKIEATLKTSMKAIIDSKINNL